VHARTLAACRPSRSVIRQSFDARERLGGSGGEVYDRGHLNADGFGLGWYTGEAQDPEDVTPEDLMPCVFTEVGPAWHNRNLHRLCQKIRSPILLAHVRAAGPGMGVCHCACHPFEWGRYLFMHNGQVAGYGKIRRGLLNSLSQCAHDFCIANSASDSALSFALFIDQLEDPLAPISPQELQRKLVKVIQIITRALDAAGVAETSLLNFVITDGTALAATRYACNKLPECKAASLYYASGSSFEPSTVAPEPQEASSDKCSKVSVTQVRECRAVCVHTCSPKCGCTYTRAHTHTHSLSRSLMHVCVLCAYTYIHEFLDAHTHTHTIYIYIYIYNCVCVCVYILYGSGYYYMYIYIYS